MATGGGPHADGDLLNGAEFSRATRTRDLAALGGGVYDLAVVGGGITGAGVARDAALRGLAVLLVEQGDFASGTSSRSSRLIHGGLRYLEQGRFGLVFEALSERRTLMRIAPHLVTPLEFLFPVYRGDRHGAATIQFGLSFYDALALFRSDSGHRRHTAAACLALEPGLNPDGLTAGFTYRDARTDDARLTLENVIDARENGAVALNYVRVEERRRESADVQILKLTDRVTGHGLEARAGRVVNATGAWVEELAPVRTTPLVSPSKGVHLVLPGDRLRVRHAVVMQDTEQDRILFAIPWDDHTLLGTTDTPFRGRPEDVRAAREDSLYLLDFANRTFPGAALTPSDVRSAWAGVRPLLANSEDDPSAASREHRILVHEPGFLSLFGGKLTTYRAMARDALDRLLGKGVCVTGRRVLPGGRRFPAGVPARAAFEADLVGRFQLDPETASHLVSTYGGCAPDVARIAAASDGGLDRIAPELPVIAGELSYALLREGVVHPEDFLRRRTPLLYKAGNPAEAVSRVTVRMAAESGPDSAEIRAWRKDLEIPAGPGAHLWL